MSNVRVLMTVEDFTQDYCTCVARAAQRGYVCEWKPLPKGYNDSKGLAALASQYDAVIAGGEVWSKKTIDALPSSFRVIARSGIGYDKIDLAAAGQKGIFVANTPGSFANAVAEGTLMLILVAVKNLVRFDREVRHGIWQPFIGNELCELTIGLYSLGNIAQRLAELLQPFGARLVAYDMSPNPEIARRCGVELLGRDELLAQSDVISIHTPLNDTTRRMFNDRYFARMKNGVVIVNTARGDVIDESALVRALKSRKVKAAALDVFHHEPIHADNPLLAMDNVVIYPHATSLTQHAFELTFDMCLDNIDDVFSGRVPRYIVNSGK